MKNKRKYAIGSYKELIDAKLELRSKLDEEIYEIKNNKIVRFASFLNAGGKNEKANDNPSMSMDLMGLLNGPIVKLISSFLINNKSTRKFFIAFVVAKEMAPYIIGKVNEIIKHDETKSN